MPNKCDCKEKCKKYKNIQKLFPDITETVYKAYKNGDSSITVTIPNIDQTITFNNIQQYDSFCELKKIVIKTVYKVATNIIQITMNNKNYTSSNGKSTIGLVNNLLSQHFYEYGYNNGLNTKINDTSDFLLKY
jgi:hypothetical protein